MTAVVTDVRRQVALGRAAESARQGELDAAAALLVELDQSDDASPEVLDLLARIRAQQKRWDEADALWARVQEKAPDDPAAAAGRKTVAAIRGHRRAARPVLPILTSATAIVVVAGAVVAGIAGGVVALGDSDEPAAHPVAQQSTPGPTSAPTSGAEERAAGLARQLAVLEAQRRAAAAAAASKLDVIQRRVAGPGVVVQRQPNAVRLVFTDGVFTAGTELSPTGQSTLDALGKRLPGLKATITVTGYSVVVPGGSGSGGSQTALLRARAATQELSAASGLPLTAFTMQSGDQAHPPYRTDAQNRTVTVTLTPAP
jgi:type VI secretion system protein ImpK